MAVDPADVYLILLILLYYIIDIDTNFVVGALIIPWLYTLRRDRFCEGFYHVAFWKSISA
jgi:hypothetical protein